jgi:tetratricopeptide (TPR) repeat protein
VPPTIQLLLAARIDRLDAEERAVMERGSVEGKVFHSGAVATLASDALRPMVPSRLLALARKELIRPDRAEFAGEDAFRFRHLLIRDAAYHAMPKEQRADLHERFAGWLERAAGERLPEYEEILAYHLEQAYRYRVELGPPDERTKELGRTAAKRLIASADRARERGEFKGARSLLTRASETSDGSVRALALCELAQTVSQMNDFRASVEAAGRAIAAAEETGDRAYALRAKLVLTESLGQIDPSHTLARHREETEAALAELEHLGDAEGILQATLALAWIAFYLGQCMRCYEILDPLVGRASELPYRHRREIAANLGVAAYFGPIPVEEAFHLRERALSIVSDSLLSQAYLGTLNQGLLAMQGRGEESRDEAARVEHLLLELSSPEMLNNTFQARGEAERFLGRPDLAEAYFREGVERWDALGETGFNSTLTAILALALCDLGRFDEAETFAERGRGLSAEDDFASQAAWRMAMARITSNRGEHDAALALADEAVTITESTDYLAWQAETLEIRGHVLSAAGRTEEARAAFETALERYERKGVIPSAARIRERLEALEHE